MIKATCSIESCETVDRLTRGWCQYHYKRWWANGDPLLVKHGPPLLDRILNRLDVGDCWEWSGARSWNGYGIISGKRDGVGKYTTLIVHRALWKELVGPLSDSLTLDHLCRNRLCANPDHLEPVSNAENIRRGFSPSQQKARAKRRMVDPSL